MSATEHREQSMSNTKHAHTPGPWSVFHSDKLAADSIVIGAERSTEDIAEVFYDGRHTVSTTIDVALANARLIRSAPDLLALARQYASECCACSGTGLVTIYSYDGNGSECSEEQPCGDCQDIRDVIAKATGERS